MRKICFMLCLLLCFTFAAAAAQEDASVKTLPSREERWTPGKYYPVYQGPGKAYGRAGNGKAKVFTGAPFTSYGKWKGWLLISYEISAGHHRFGWLRESDVGSDAFAGHEQLPFTMDEEGIDYHVGVLTRGTALTDDPSRTNAPISAGSMVAGNSVHCLGLYEDWMLVEGYAYGKLAMGFVPAGIVDQQHGYTADARREIGHAVTYTEAEINAAMDVVEQAIRDDWPGTRLMALRYDEKRSNEEADWYAEEGMQCMILYSDLNAMALEDYEIGGSDYEFVVRRLPGEAWELCNWGYR